MRVLAIILFVLAAFTLICAFGTRPPAGADRDVAAGFMIGTLILPALFAVAGVWCYLKGSKNARIKKQETLTAQG